MKSKITKKSELRGKFKRKIHNQMENQNFKTHQTKG